MDSSRSFWIQNSLSEQYLVTEIHRSEVTKPRNRKKIFRNITANILLHMCMFIPITHKCAHTFLAKNFLVITYPFISLCVRFHKDLSFCCGVILFLVNLWNFVNLLKDMFSISWSSNLSFPYVNNQILLWGRSVFKTSGRNLSFQQYNH